MRASNGFALATGLALAFLYAPPSGAEPMRQLILETAPGAPQISSATHHRSRLLERIEDLGLQVVGSLRDGLPPATAASGATAGGPFGFDESRVLLLEAPDSLTAARALQELAEDPEVDWIEFNQRREAALMWLDPGFPNDPMFQDSRQWGLRNLGPAGAYGGVAGADVHALEAWEISVGGNDVRLAIADTGIDPDHPDLQAVMPDGGPRIEQGMNVTTEPNSAYADSFGHGTPVAGVAAALTHEGAHFDSLGVAGLCGGDGRGNLGCRIIPIKITPGHSGEATSYDISRAMIYATEAGARAMNLSFAGSAPSTLERKAMHYAITHGCVVVAAAGNLGASSPRAKQYPAAYSVEGFCIQVGGSDPFDERINFSSYGPGLDLVAPAVNVWTTFMTYRSSAGALRNGYVPASGTSFAAPFVTGAVGLLAAARPELTDTDFQNLLRESADDIGAPGVDEQTGWGRLNVARALAAVPPRFGIWHDEVPAQVFVPESVESLYIGESGPGNLDARLWPSAQRIEAMAIVALPDSFLDSVRVWPRVGGTTTIRGDFRIPYFAPWSRVTALDSESFTLSGFLYHLEECLECATPEDHYVPLPPDASRFGFTVIGRVDRPPSLTLLAPTGVSAASPGDTLNLAWEASDPDEVTAIEVWLDGAGSSTLMARLPGTASHAGVALPCPAPFEGAGRLRVRARDEHGRQLDETSVERPIELRARDCEPRGTLWASFGAAPNPFRGVTRFVAPAGSRLTIVDVAGRVVRRVALGSGAGEFRWDGRDQSGRAVGPGLYLVRCVSPQGARRAKVLKLD